MEGQVVLDGSGRLDGFDLESGADVGQGAGTEGEGLRVVLLPSLILRPEVEGPRVLKIGGENNSLITCLTGKLDAEIPRVERHEGKLEVLGEQMFLGKGVEAVDGIPEGTCRSNVFPCQGGQARWRSIDHISVDHFQQYSGKKCVRLDWRFGE